ncbi:DNA primase [bacterium]|nr:DNA primase [bacterium]
MEPKDLIKQKLDIAEIIGEYVQLKPAGSGSLKGLCPFHNERSPSFHVSRERQIYKCFGCDKGGDMFSFVMEMEGMAFPEALRHLGRRAGVEIPEFRPQSPDLQDKRERMLEMYDVAAKYYADVLREYPFGATARAYIEKRNIAPEMRELFRLGAAPESWDALTGALKKKGFLDKELVEAGLALQRKSGEGVIDRFRNRIMVPICDAQGQVIAFTGRVIPGTPGADEGGKYVNSPETLLYRKSDVLYGLHLAKQAIRKTGEVIVVEGNLDVIASHKAGVENVVASSGTALTEAQLRQLGRYTRRIVFCLDDDAAGFSAAKRALELALQLQSSGEDFDIRCLMIPAGAGKDPDEIVQKDVALWKKIAAHSTSIVEYVFQKTFQQFRAGDMGIDERKKLIDALLPYVQRLARQDEQHLYLLQLADTTHVSLDVLKSIMQKEEKEGREASVHERQIGRKEGEKKKEKEEGSSRKQEDPMMRALSFVFAHALSDESMTEAILEKFQGKELPEPWGKLYGALRGVYTSPQFRASLSGQKQTLFSQLRTYLDRTTPGTYEDAIDRAVLLYDEIVVGLSHTQKQEEVRRQLIMLARARMEEQKKSLEAAIRQAETSGNTALLSSLLAEYTALLTEFRKVK